MHHALPPMLLSLALLTGAGSCEPSPGPDPTPTPADATPSAAPTSTPAAPTPTAVPRTPTPVPTPFEVIERGGLLEATNETCSDGIDNDTSGYLDCGDRSCTHTNSVTVCGVFSSGEATDALCSNGKDDDNDGYKDCQDFDCAWNGDVGVCDRDGDNVKPKDGDCFDHPTENGALVASPSIPEMCGDKVDNNCDGWAEEEGCIQLDLGTRRVDYVYDGDTVEISGLGKVRMLGVDTPETESSGSAAECYGEEAKTFSLQSLYGKSVHVMLDPFDQEIGFKDVYGRWLAHLYLSDGRYYEEILVKGGWACATGETWTILTSDELEAWESDAMDAGTGLWGACGSNPGRVCL